MTTCGSCGAETEPGGRFCPSCGASLATVCATCGAALPHDAAFCPSCGAAVAPDDIGGSRAGERKLVTVLFADVTGSTSLGEQLDPERLREVLQTYFTAMREEIEAEGGTVEKFIGDAVMAAFGVPIAHEDDPARALRAATRMLARLEDVNQDLSERHEVRLQIRIGVNTGEVLATTDPKPGEAMVTGDVVNAAQRLEAAALPGTVVLGERTARSVPRARLIDLGPLELKGKAEPVRGYRLAGDDLVETERGVPGLRAPMVGRDAEMDLLRSVYGRTGSERKPSLVTVYGDAGVGKSRLTKEFLAWSAAQDPPPLVLRGRCLPYGDGIAYWPLAEILKGHAGVLDTDATELALEKIRKLGHDLFTAEVTADAALATAALAHTIGLPDQDSPLASMDPDQVRDEVDAAWRSFFSALAAASPVVVVIEDIHWAEPVLLDLLDTLADRVEGPVMFLCPSRPDLTSRRPTWGGGRRSMSAIALDPLTSGEAQHLIELLLTVDDLPPSVHATMVERAEGNPFFLEEIIRRLIDDGSVEREGDRWRAKAAIADVQIPDTVQAVLASRIDLLDPPDKRILQAASVVGRVFWTGPVADLADVERAGVAEAMHRLEDRELVVSRPGSTIAGEREFLFKHILTRDVAYGSIPRRERIAAHEAVATWLETTAGDRAPEFAELLAYHGVTAVKTALEVGEVPDEDLRRRALRWTLSASRTARKRVVFATSERLAQSALDLAADDRERTDALEALAKVMIDQAVGDLAWRYFVEAADACERVEPFDGMRVAQLCADACEIAERWPGSMASGAPPEHEVQAVLERGVAAVPPGDNRERIRLFGLRASWLFAFPRDDATMEELEAGEAAGMEAAEAAIRLGLPNLASAALDQANGPYLSSGLYDRAEHAWLRRREIMPQVTSIAEIADFYAMGAWMRTVQGRYEEAIALADEGTALVGGGVRLFGEIHGRSWKIRALETLGRWDDAIAEFVVMRDLLGDRRDPPPYFCAASYAKVATIHARRGQRVESDLLATILGGLLPERGIHLYHDMVVMHLARGEIDAARARQLPYAWRTMIGEALTARAQAAAAAGAWDEVPTLLDEMRSCAAASTWPFLAAEIYRLGGRAAIAAGDVERGLERLAVASDAFGAIGVIWDRAVTDLEMAEAGARDRAAAAADVFQQLRTPAHARRAQDAT